MKKTVVLLVIVILLPMAAWGGNPTDPLAIVFPYQWGGSIEKGEFNEPSGLVFHPGRGTLFAVGDNGDLGEFGLDGKVVKTQHLGDLDLEGVTCDPATGLLYLIVEGEEKVLEVEPESFAVKREFVLEREFEGKEIMKEGGQGIEGITFAPDARHPEGGVFYIANQAFDLDAVEGDLSAICEVVLPLRSRKDGGTVGISRYFIPGVIDLSGLHYDAETVLIYAISDSRNVFLLVRPGGEVVRSYALPERDQEGIAVDADGVLYITRDSGGIVKYQNKGRRER
ncbi:MAG: hypothetical protein HOC74_01090 [Gemmatimonadetes bacterium]|jgi:uncharacterized protein YjiK|nr:hypothetical protein [Gemmatimonadota bacterium]